MYRLVHRHHHPSIRPVAQKGNRSDVELVSGLGPVVKNQLLIEILQLSSARLFSGLGDLDHLRGTPRRHEKTFATTPLNTPLHRNRPKPRVYHLFYMPPSRKTPQVSGGTPKPSPISPRKPASAKAQKAGKGKATNSTPTKAKNAPNSPQKPLGPINILDADPVVPFSKYVNTYALQLFKQVTVNSFSMPKC